MDIYINNKYTNLYPGSKFTIKNSNNVYILLGYNSDRNIVYFDDNNINYINNLSVGNIDIINNVVYIQKSNYPERNFKY